MNRVSAPASTGGAGTTFEQHVGAYWLAQLLIGSIPPILIETTVAEVAFQTGRLGWHTDDFLIVCAASGAVRHLAGQVKRGFIVSASDKECERAVGGFWRDFNGKHFSKDKDRLALVTLRGTRTLLAHFVGLLDCARAARDGAEFEERLGTTGFISKTARRYYGELRKIIGAIERQPVTAADIWPFLRVVHVLSLDLHSSTRQAEAHIKSALALTVQEGDAVASAAASWNELVGEASTAMAAGRSVRREELPAAMLARHGVIGTNERRVLQALGDHTATVLRGIRSTLGRDLHLSRGTLVHDVLQALENTQVVIVTGPAGSGKSVVGKDGVGVLASDHFLFAFRVEEFAQAHLDATLAAAQVPANWARLRAVLGAQCRKVVLVEGVERLLESTTRDAFSDLMTLAADDPDLRVVLTCREYSIEQVRTSLLQHHDLEHTVICVPPLDDAELTEVQAVYPALATPLRSPALRNILRNPFILDKALGLPWSSEIPLPRTEREFRALFWRDIVRGGNRVTPALGRLRQEVLQAIAVRRARALSAHVCTTGFDGAVVDSLRGDSLIVSSPDNPLLVATAHDVIEDWAILQWLEEQHLSEAPLTALSDAIGAHPAVRRSFRAWVAELVERDANASDRLFHAAIAETHISAQFRDDALVSLLKAPSAPDFLASHEAQLFANQRALLRRVIHLLRMACVKAPEWFAHLAGQRMILKVPDGPAWPAVLRLVHRNLAAFADDDRPLLLGLVEDAVRGVDEGAEDAAGIAYWLLDGLLSYGCEEPRERVLKVIAHLPGAAAVRFEAVLRGHLEGGAHRDIVAKNFQELIFTGIEGMPAARDLPDVVISVGAEWLLASEESIDAERRYAHRSLDIDLYFGIRERLCRTWLPPSALRGPWIQLLGYHRAKALDFYIKVFNHCADWYAHPRLPDHLEAAWEVTLTFADGSRRNQWMNWPLWGLYRDMTAGPDPLKSMLMALERWLFEVGKQEPQELDGILVDILRRSDIASLAAVVASIATAYPQAAGEALLALVSVRDYVTVDRSRLTHESQLRGNAGMADMFPTLGADHQLYESEREDSDAFPQRRYDLEAAIVSLQVGPLASRVHEILDNHLAALPPREQQDEGDRLWRLAIHRMDLRQHRVSNTPGPRSADSEAKSGDPPGRYVQLDPNPPDADLQAMVDEGTSHLDAMSARLSVLRWGIEAFWPANGACAPSQWAGRLAEAQAMDREVEQEDGSQHAPGLVAAVCIRDHWSDLSPAQKGWCVDAACGEVLRHASAIDWMERMRRNPTAADRACAFVLAKLLRKPLDQVRAERVKIAFVAAFTHPVLEVQSFATWSIDETVWTTDRAFALRCVNAIATEAAFIDRAQDAEAARPYRERRGIAEIMVEATADIRARFWDEGALAEDAHVALDISGGFRAEALKRILVILGRVPHDPLAVAAFARASRALARWWTAGDDRRGHHREFETESDVSQRIQEFLLRASPEAAEEVLAPLLATIDRHSYELHSVLQGLTKLEDTSSNATQYWFLWGLFAGAVKRAQWLSRLDTHRHPSGAELLSAVFLKLHWKDNVRHWPTLDGHEQLVHTLFESLPATAVVFDAYTQFLYHIGERSLPHAFARLAASLRGGDVQTMLATASIVFHLEVLLGRYVYGRPVEVKRDGRVRNAVLFILDCLVESGSSAAFFMRDDLVTPVSV